MKCDESEMGQKGVHCRTLVGGGGLWHLNVRQIRAEIFGIYLNPGQSV